MANILFISCYKATALAEKKLHAHLSLGEQAQLRLHQLICQACNRYVNHSILIDKWLKNREKQEDKLLIINDEEIEKLKEKILEVHKKREG